MFFFGSLMLAFLRKWLESRANSTVGSNQAKCFIVCCSSFGLSVPLYLNFNFSFGRPLWLRDTTNTTDDGTTFFQLFCLQDQTFRLPNNYWGIIEPNEKLTRCVQSYTSSPTRSFLFRCVSTTLGYLIMLNHTALHIYICRITHSSVEVAQGRPLNVSFRLLIVTFTTKSRAFVSCLFAFRFAFASELITLSLCFRTTSRSYLMPLSEPDWIRSAALFRLSDRVSDD